MSSRTAEPPSESNEKRTQRPETRTASDVPERAATTLASSAAGPDKRLSRRNLIGAAAGVVGALSLSRLGILHAQSPLVDGPQPPTLQVPDDPTKVQGRPLSKVGIRSPFVQLERSPWQQNAPQATAGWTFSPLQNLEGTITPSDLHFERSHAGTALIDPAKHQLVVHGMVERPRVYTPWDLQRLPQESHIYFIECSGNSLDGYSGGKRDSTAQNIHGLVSTSEWGGVTVRTLIEQVGLQPGATWALFEGADAAVMTRSVPVEKLMDDAIIAFTQNGEPIRPEQGFPMRLVLPGWEGNMQIKWLRRIEFGSAPFHTKEETRHYTDRMPDGRARQFTFPMEAKSVITWPSPGQGISGAGRWQISGLAWSGRGRIERVEVSTDNGSTWSEARILTDRRPRATVRFHHQWDWDGRDTVIMSRAIDQTGYRQPTRRQLLDARGEGYVYHFNGIQPWRVHADGTLTNGYVS